MSSKTQSSSTESKLQSTESEFTQSEDEEKNALEVLTRIRQKLVDLGDPPFFSSNVSEDDQNGDQDCTGQQIPQKIKCICCLSQIKKGNLLVSMPCCGCICHVQCIHSILKEGPNGILHACPICLTKFTPEFSISINNICTLMSTPVDGNTEAKIE